MILFCNSYIATIGKLFPISVKSIILYPKFYKLTASQKLKSLSLFISHLVLQKNQTFFNYIEYSKQTTAYNNENEIKYKSAIQKRVVSITRDSVLLGMEPMCLSELFRKNENRTLRHHDFVVSDIQLDLSKWESAKTRNGNTLKNNNFHNIL